MSFRFSKKTSIGILFVILLMLVIGIFFAFNSRHRQLTRSEKAERILKLGHGLPSEHPVHQAMVFLADRVRELSHGMLQIHIYPSGMVGSETECFRQIQNGQLDMSKTSMATLETGTPALEAINAPYVFRDFDHCWKVLDGPIGQRLATQLPGMRAVAYFDAGSRNFYTIGKPIRKVEDLAGLKIRVQSSRSAMEMVKAFGASPTPIPWGELYSALSQGTIDAAENNLPSFDLGRHSEVCKYFTFSEHTRTPDVLLIGNRTWCSLTTEQQGWILQAGREASMLQRQLWADAEKKSRQRAEQEHVEFITIRNRKPFEEKMQTVYETLPESAKALIREIKEVK